MEGNFDYVGVDETVSFDKADRLSQCVNISIVSDGLTENDESFVVRILNGTFILTTATVIIRNNSKKFENVITCTVIVLYLGCSWQCSVQ